MAGSSKDQLTAILKGDLKGVRKPNPTIIVGPRVRNVVWKKLVEKYRKEGLNNEQIIEKIMDFDELVEAGLVTEEKINSIQSK
jgi:hypothetical protein